MSTKRYLTKSKFKLAIECPAKLYYIGKKEYANQSLDNSLLLALADGGYQVGELAKCYFPGGHEIKTLEYKESLAQTNELLQLDQVIIYEAAIATKNLFIRADILVKDGEHIDLYEVKAKSFNPNELNLFRNKNLSIKAKWAPYLYDVAFQKYVIKKAFPNFDVVAHLMMANKTVTCATEGLNQKFKIVKDPNKRKFVTLTKKVTKADLRKPILSAINVDEECKYIKTLRWDLDDKTMTFHKMIQFFANKYVSDEKINYPISRNCEFCEFNTTQNDKENNLLSGKEECWKEQLGWKDKDFKYPSVLDVWSLRTKTKLLQSGIVKMSKMTKSDINIKSDGKPGLSASERQWLQIEKVKNKDNSIWLDKKNLKNEINSWVYPLHFIDFETAMVAIPFNKGRKTYEGIAFQFSHHIVYRDGTVEHAGQYLNTVPGVFPNYDFIRALKKQLSKDKGTIFRYSNHENTFLNIIYNQLQSDKSDIPDRDSLCKFIRSITHSIGKGKEQWEGKRNMVDMWEIVKRYYYDPYTNGSNSIKKVLPSILNSSDFLKEKYSKPIYGAEKGIKSLNYKDWQWLQNKKGKVNDPYKTLPKMFQDIDDKNMELLSSEDELRDGGAALTAYARLQFVEMSDYERTEIKNALLKYCELDTLAMVMIYEGWLDLLSKK
jgi:hypothetical protein